MITQVLSSGGGGREGGGDGRGDECVFWVAECKHSTSMSDSSLASAIFLFTSDLAWHLKQQKTEEEVKALNIRRVHS